MKTLTKEQVRQQAFEEWAREREQLNSDLHRRCVAAGYPSGIASMVRRRHLPLLHVRDYTECYSAYRDAFCPDPHGGPGPAASTEPR